MGLFTTDPDKKEEKILQKGESPRLQRSHTRPFSPLALLQPRRRVAASTASPNPLPPAHADTQRRSTMRSKCTRR